MAQFEKADRKQRTARIGQLVRHFGVASPRPAVVLGAALFLCALIAALVASCVHLLPPSLSLTRGDAAGHGEVMASSEPVASGVSAAGDEAEKASDPSVRLVVHVDGAVAAPGVYLLESSDPRVNDAVLLAGGLSDEADTAAVNLAAPLVDGAKVHIPAVGETLAQQIPNTGGDPDRSGAAAPVASSGLINLNAASASELEGLPGIGPSLAQAIVEERAHGAFASVDDLARVSGIGSKKIEKLRDYACV